MTETETTPPRDFSTVQIDKKSLELLRKLRRSLSSVEDADLRLCDVLEKLIADRAVSLGIEL